MNSTTRTSTRVRAGLGLSAALAALCLTAACGSEQGGSPTASAPGEPAGAVHQRPATTPDAAERLARQRDADRAEEQLRHQRAKDLQRWQRQQPPGGDDRARYDRWWLSRGHAPA